jgi:UDP-4-amino-4-deoxy-L-arabinose formyltransferase/UDP-glucuronic acid dehydrogenase (UDP-4-keto-hexauronic acid decarboxylating)
VTREAGRGGGAPARAVVMGYHAMGCLGFDALRRHGFDVAAVFTHRDNPAEEIWWPSLRERAEAAGVAVHVADDPADPAVSARIAEAHPDFLFSFYYRALIPAGVRALAPRGALNLHGSLLPRYRGRAPVNWVLVNGETETGVTLHHMVDRADAGDIVDQERVAVGSDDTAYTLYGRLERAAARLLDRSLPLVREGRAAARPQDLARGSCFGARRPEDGRIDWALPARRLYDLVRAVTHPYPGAFTDLRGRRLLVWWAQPLDVRSGAPPGTVLGADGTGIRAATGDGVLRLITVQREGCPEQPASAFAAAEDLAPGTRLGTGEARP